MSKFKEYIELNEASYQFLNNFLINDTEGELTVSDLHAKASKQLCGSSDCCSEAEYLCNQLVELLKVMQGVTTVENEGGVVVKFSGVRFKESTVIVG
jgi:hypothetical protein